VGNIYLLIKIGEHYPKSAMDDDKPVYINPYYEMDSDELKRLMGKITNGTSQIGNKMSGQLCGLNPSPLKGSHKLSVSSDENKDPILLKGGDANQKDRKEVKDDDFLKN